MVVDVGTNPTPFVIPPDHAYDVAPLPDNVTEDPAHTVDELAVTVTVGSAFTVTVTLLEVAGLPAAQMFEEFIMQVTTFPFVKDEDENVELFVPVFTPFTCH